MLSRPHMRLASLAPSLETTLASSWMPVWRGAYLGSTPKFHEFWNFNTHIPRFPFNVLNDPMYDGSSMCFLAGALWCAANMPCLASFDWANDYTQVSTSCGCPHLRLYLYCLSHRPPLRGVRLLFSHGTYSFSLIDSKSTDHLPIWSIPNTTKRKARRHNKPTCEPTLVTPPRNI